MTTKTLDFGTPTHDNGKPGGQEVKPTGAFRAGDEIVINWTVPAGATRTQIGVAQDGTSDADLTVMFNGRQYGGINPPLATENNPAPGPRTAKLTADAPVTNANVHVTVQVPATTPRKNQP